MQALELRRHSLRIPPAEHLSEEGLRLAAWVRTGLGRFEAVVSSPAPRAVETAQALGRAPDRLDPRWRELGAATTAELPWPTTFEATRAAVARSDSAAGHTAATLWRAIRAELEQLSECGALLVVTHGGFAELVAAGSGLAPVPEEAHGPVRCLEAIRLTVAGGRARSLAVLRLPDGMTRV